MRIAITLSILVGYLSPMIGKPLKLLGNAFGNGFGTVVSRGEGELNTRKLNEVMAHPLAIGTDISGYDPQRPDDDEEPASMPEPPKPKASAAQ